MNRRPQFVETVKIHEGLRLRPYRDTVGKLTIGYGHNLDAKPLSWLRVGPPITKRVAEAILETDVDDAIRDLDIYLPWWRDLDDVREEVLADMSFNMGIGNAKKGLRSFRNTLAAIREGRWRAAHDGMLSSKWAEQVGGRAVRLSKMMLTGVVVAV